MCAISLTCQPFRGRVTHVSCPHDNWELHFLLFLVVGPAASISDGSLKEALLHTFICGTFRIFQGQEWSWRFIWLSVMFVNCFSFVFCRLQSAMRLYYDSVWFAFPPYVLEAIHIVRFCFSFIWILNSHSHRHIWILLSHSVALSQVYERRCQCMYGICAHTYAW